MYTLSLSLSLSISLSLLTELSILPFKETAVNTLSAYCSLVPGFISISSVGSGGRPSEKTALLDRPSAGTLAPSGLFLAS